MALGTRRPIAGGEPIDVAAPHRRFTVLGRMHEATTTDVADAIETAMAAAPGWRALSFDDRAAIFLKAADLLAGPWRDTINAATMLGQSKTCYQADIDAACELADFWRFNVHFAREHLGRAADLAGGSGTGSTTGRSKDSSSPSPPSTSRRSPATCRPRRPSWATSSSGSPHRHRSCRRIT